MSLDYQNQEEALQSADTSAEQPENVQRVTPAVPYFSLILIACLIGVFVFQTILDGADSILLGGDLSALQAGFIKPLFIEGQYWRILTGATLHGGLMHLAFNCYALYVLGKLIETLSNRLHVPIVFLLSIVGGGILSFIFLPDGISIGASGGILGFLGYLTIYGFKRRKLLPEGFLKNMIFNIVFIAFIGLFVIPNIDNFGHLGGLLAGALYGFLQIPSDLYEDPRRIGRWTKTPGFIALGIFIITSLLSIFLLLR